MIDCPYCGNPNRKGSKYCSDCGKRLDTASVVYCPSCKGPNPPGNPLCQFCQAELTPPALVEEDEADAEVQPPLPTPEQPAESAAERPVPVTSSRPELPSWLYQRPAEEPVKPERSAGVPSPIRAEPADEQEGNKYLSGIRGVLPDTDVWLSSSISRFVSGGTDSSGG
jgi:hypothetical protein